MKENDTPKIKISEKEIQEGVTLTRKSRSWVIRTLRRAYEKYYRFDRPIK